MILLMRHSSKDPPERLASEILDRFRWSEIYPRERITQLAEIATSDDEEAARSATSSIFAALVERLADSFEPRGVALYNRLFSQLIQFCRNTERGRLIDRELAGFGLLSEDDMVMRAERLRGVSKYEPVQGLEVKRAIVLSRVTLGADVAVTSVMIERLKQRFPNAEIALLGGRKARELFGGDPRLSFREVAYQRAGTIINRLLAWIDLLGSVRDLIDGLAPGERLILDPDTRLTQLGLLPLIESENVSTDPIVSNDYLFFPSREYGSDTSHSLGELASAWLDEVFGVSAQRLPRVSLKSGDLDSAKTLIELIKRGGAGPMVTINFGVGENPLKRVQGGFEESLVSRLIQGGATIILDRGAGEEETKRADQIVRSAMGVNRIVEVDEMTLPVLLKMDRLKANLVVWRGRIGMLAAMIAASDLYIGYDSAGQHIAAALGVPAINVFTGFSSPRMIERWRPVGPAEVQVIAVDGKDANAILARATDCARAMLKRVR